MIINIAKDFSQTPGFRHRDDGPYSGEEFRQEKLEPLFKDKNFNGIVTIILDGAIGYATSFLEEAFGGLARDYGINRVYNQLKFISEEDPLLVEEIRDYITHCNEKF